MDFRTNSWYRLSTATSMKYQLSLAGNSSTPDEYGNVAFTPSNNNATVQQWQLFRIDYSTFMLRTKASGPHGYLATLKNNTSKLRIRNGIRTDTSMLWRVIPWGDGTFHFSNVANGRGYHLDCTEEGTVGMSKNTTQPQPGQAFSFIQLGQINDSTFSTVNTPSPSRVTSRFSTATTQPSASAAGESALVRVLTTSSKETSNIPSPTASSSPFPPSIPAQSELQHLSPTAALGVGVTIGVVGVITFVAFGLFIYQKWTRRRSPESLHYRRAKLWRGFSPQPRKSRISVKSTGDIYVAELPDIATPIATPCAVLASPLEARHFSWQSWPTESSPTSPGVPLTPNGHAVELPV